MTAKLLLCSLCLTFGSFMVVGQRANDIFIRTSQEEISSERPPCTEDGSCSNDTDTPINNEIRLRKEVWVIPLIVLSSLNIFMLIIFEFYVVIKTFGTIPSRRHLFLGQTLLLGLFLSSIMGFVFALEPHKVTCTVIRFGLGLSYALVFVTLLVKLVFLISLNSGVYLPANYQSLLICFGIGIQLAIGIQWLVQQPPHVTTYLQVKMCQTKFEVLVLALIYDILLLIAVTVLAIKCRTIRDNHKEATFIGISIGFTVVIWITWLVASMVLDKRLRDTCMAFGVVSNATITFLVMFLPKRRQLAAMGEEGMYLDDRGSRLSTRSSAVAPSFFHITPQTNVLKPSSCEKPKKFPKPSLYERVMYAPTAGRMLRYSYPAHVNPVADFYEPHKEPHSIYYHHLDRPRITSVNPNVHFYRGRY